MAVVNHCANLYKNQPNSSQSQATTHGYIISTLQTTLAGFLTNNSLFFLPCKNLFLAVPPLTPSILIHPKPTATMTVSRVGWSSMTDDHLYFFNEDVLAFPEAVSTNHQADPRDEPSMTWARVWVVTAVALLWLFKERIYYAIASISQNLSNCTSYSLSHTYNYVDNHTMNDLVSPLTRSQLINLPGQINKGILHLIITIIDLFLRPLSDLKLKIVEPPPPHVCPVLPPVIQQHYPQPRYVGCTCPPPPCTTSEFWDLTSELTEAQRLLEEKRLVIRIFRGDISAHRADNHELQLYKTKFEREQVSRRIEKEIFRKEKAQLHAEVAAAGAKRDEMEQTRLPNELASWLGEELPKITDKMNKADIMATHREILARLNQIYREEHTAAMNNLRTQHDTALAGLEARIATLSADCAKYKANGVRHLVKEKHNSIPNLQSTIASLRRRLETTTHERQRAHARAEKLHQRFQRDFQNAGNGACCHIADLELDLRATETLESERSERHAKDREHWERVNEIKAENVWLATLAGIDAEGMREEDKECIRVSRLVLDSGLGNIGEVEEMLREFPRLQRMVADAGIRGWGELERLLMFHGAMMRAAKDKKGDKSSS